MPDRRRSGAVPLALGLILMSVPAVAQPPARVQDPRGALLLILLIPLALVVFVALELVLWVLAPGPLSATCRALERARGRCLLLGLAAAAVTLFLMSAIGQHPPLGKNAGPLLLGIVALGCLTGITAMSAMLGRGALDLAGHEGSRALAVLAGSTLLGLVILFPVVGQVLAAYFLVVGLGGALSALLFPTHKSK